jgi:hypothetical protein
LQIDIGDLEFDIFCTQKNHGALYPRSSV